MQTKPTAVAALLIAIVLLFDGTAGLIQKQFTIPWLSRYNTRSGADIVSGRAAIALGAIMIVVAVVLGLLAVFALKDSDDD